MRRLSNHAREIEDPTVKVWHHGSPIICGSLKPIVLVFGKSITDEGFNAAADLNGDGKVGFPDFCGGLWQTCPVDWMGFS